jgi:hypothetical protein
MKAANYFLGFDAQVCRGHPTQPNEADLAKAVERLG